MKRCIELASKGLGMTYPNPLVGCVIIYKDKVIGEGWHKKAGENHAEIEAINNVKDKSKLKKSTLYVNLEPCSHYGKTGPCTDIIISHKIKKIVIGTKDFSKKVNGKGIEILEKNGCEVKVGFLEKECFYLNRRFFEFHIKNKPYIILKWAESEDGFISPNQKKRLKKSPYWLSNQYSIQRSHKWRSEEQAILIGVQTAIDDNPSLTVRNYKGTNPLRCIIDPNNRLPKNSIILKDKYKTVILNNKFNKIEKSNKWVKINFDSLKSELTKFFHQQKIQSIIIEGGSKTLNYFIKQAFFNEVRKIKTEKKLFSGIKSPIFKNKFSSKEIITNNIIEYYF